MEGYPVKVYIYDLSKGLARSMSMAFLGKQLDGIWHTGIVVFDQEFFYGGMGIESCQPGCTIMGQPDSIVEVGRSQIPFDMFMDYLEELSKTSFRPDCYHLLEHNCNTFSNELGHFLTGNNIPSHITNLPQEVLNTPFGAMIKPFVDAMSVSPEGGHQVFPSQPSSTTTASSKPSSAVASADTPSRLASGQSTVTKSAEQNKQAPSDSKGDKVEIVTFTDLKIVSDYSSARSDIENLPAEDLRLLDEIHEFLATENCSWGLGRQHLKVLGKCLRSKNMPEAPKSRIARLLQCLVTHEDNIPLITHDPSNTLLNVLYQFENQPITVQISIGRMACNFCQHTQGMEWLLSTTERTINDHQSCTSTTVSKLCAFCLLSDTADLYTTGAALAQNLTSSKMTEESAVEVGIALVQLLSKDLPEKTVSHSLQALYKCMVTSSEVSEVAAVMGFNVDKYITQFPKLNDICFIIKEQLDKVVC